MPFFPSLPANASIGDLYALKPDATKAQHELSRVIMRGESPLSPAQRETIAAYVSKLNQCSYCYNGHAQIAVNLGVERATLERIVDDVDAAPVEETFKPILRFVKKLTLTPSKMIQADADAVYHAGWSERALHDAILVCCRFNFMNRLSLAHGLDPQAEAADERARTMRYAEPER